jgi:BirA family biotin operon repressor/biotin-[acetyl-CoA-carboxylase] ligase
MTISWRYETVESTESTNSDLLKRWHDHLLIEPTSLMAFDQTAGRGKRGKQWISGKEQSLTFSMAYPFSPNFSMMKLQGLTLVCGLTLLKSLIKFLQIPSSSAKQLGLGLKWPNDILLQHRKLGGILVEGGQKSPDQPFWMVIGVGLNIGLPRQPPDNLETANIEEINSANIPIHFETLWKYLTSEVGNTLDYFAENSFSAFHEEWNTWDSWINQQLTVQQNGKTLYEGKSIGVNSFGYLMLETPMGFQEISSGDVSLVKQMQ